jgi:hypothetical protein
MKTIIAGSRNIINPNELIAALKTVDWIIAEVVCDCARGADTLLALWDGSSRGTMHMINIARQKGLKVKVWLVK